jgi:hypothetical protein
MIIKIRDPSYAKHLMPTHTCLRNVYKAKNNRRFVNISSLDMSAVPALRKSTRNGSPVHLCRSLRGCVDEVKNMRLHTHPLGGSIFREKPFVRGNNARREVCWIEGKDCWITTKLA